MQKSTKVIVTIVAVALFFILSAVVTGVRSDAGYSTPGFLAIILFGSALLSLPFSQKSNTQESKTSSRAR